MVQHPTWQNNLHLTSNCIFVRENLPLSDFNAKIKSYTVEPNMSTAYMQSEINQEMYSLEDNIQAQTVTLEMDISGDSRFQITLNESRMKAEFLAGTILFLPDSFYYDSVLISASAMTFQSDALASVTYTFRANRKLGEVTVPDAKIQFYCNSTVPLTDAYFSITSSITSDTYVVAGVTFTNVKPGTTIEIDGYKKRVLINGAPGAHFCDIVEFPKLKPGFNQFVDAGNPDTLSVRFKPTFL